MLESWNELQGSVTHLATLLSGGENYIFALALGTLILLVLLSMLWRFRNLIPTFLKPERNARVCGCLLPDERTADFCADHLREMSLTCPRCGCSIPPGMSITLIEPFDHERVPEGVLVIGSHERMWVACTRASCLGGEEVFAVSVDGHWRVNADGTRGVNLWANPRRGKIFSRVTGRVVPDQDNSPAPNVTPFPIRNHAPERRARQTAFLQLPPAQFN